MISALSRLRPLLTPGVTARNRVVREVMQSRRFAQQLQLLATRLARPLATVSAEAERDLREIATVQDPAYGLMFDYGLGPMHTSAWTVDADLDALAQLKQLNQGSSLVFLPTHRSYADAFILSRLLRDNGLRRNYILGGNNLGFWPLGTIIRRSGGVLIRRNFQDDEVYKLVVREYLGWLAAQRNNLEWYMEGGRSRTGKLRPPKYGLLRYLVDAIESGGVEDMLLVPVSTTYNQMQEVSKLAAEEAGAAKGKEGLLWLAGYARMQQKWVGTAYVRFGEPLSLRDALARADSDGPGKWTVAKIAFEVFQRINRVTPVTGPALVTFALLGVRDRALTLAELQELVSALLAYAAARQLPQSHLEDLKTVEGTRATLDTLVTSGVVTRYTAGTEAVFKVAAGQHTVAAFYRNSAIHWFVNRAIMEVAFVDVSDTLQADPLELAWVSAFALRDLLKFEFFFSDKETFREELRAESLQFDPTFREHLNTPRERHAMLMRAPFLLAHRVLTPFLEAYFIVADRLAALPPEQAIDRGALIESCVKVGHQYVLQQKLRNPECVSREVFGNALRLADNRGLLQPGDETLTQRRQQFSAELWDAVSRVAAIEQLDHQRRRDAGDPHP